jgi:hypothetical protein
MLSFNRNNVDFIWTPGVVNEDYEEPIYNEWTWTRDIKV